MINVQIVDDHKILANGIRLIINESDIANVSAIYYDLDSCRMGLASFRPDILLLDVQLPDGNGVDFCAEIKQLYPDLKILMLTAYSDFSIAKRSLCNGALGYVLKSATSEEIIAGIRAVNSGEKFLSDEIDILLKENDENAIYYLTSREKEVLNLIGEGFSTSEISDRLFLSMETIKTYRKRLMLKFNAKNSMMLIKMAVDRNLI